MSLFDVIKYPISDAPTKEELETLPTVLYNRWLEKTHWSLDRDERIFPNILNVVIYYKNCNPDIRIVDIGILRKLIKAYDEPI